jgi:acyl-CoA thioester hydrolase
MVIQHTTQIRVRYGETDRMGYAYYGNHALYFEVGRVELLRAAGYPYNVLEADGIMCPVTALDVRYVRPALYDELLTQYVIFDTEITNALGKLVSVGKVTLAFVDATTRRKCDAPALLIAKITNYTL